VNVPEATLPAEPRVTALRLAAVERTRHKSLALILARELASNLALPMFLVDPDGTLVYFNEAGEEILGQSFATTGELAAHEWGARWHPERLDGTPYPLDGLPLVVALRDKRPAHDVMRITAVDGTRREIHVTAIPLFSHVDEFAGAVAMFWDPGTWMP
jgi:PAS domain-containing protein